MLPQEIASKKIIPYFKGVLIHRLKSLGYSQRRIAEIFEISQPQVHKYLLKTPEFYYDNLSVMGIDRRELEDYIGLLIHFINRRDKARFVIVLSSIVDRLTREYLCRVKEYFTDYCIGSNIFTDPFIEEYRYYLGRILNIRGLLNLIPEVGMNIAYAPHRPTNIMDIIGLPGRIIRAGKRPVAVGDPIYGGSKHTARVLMVSARYLDEVHVAANIRYDTWLVEFLAKEAFGVFCGPHRDQTVFWLDLEECLKGSRGTEALIDRGGPGIEPVIYLLTNSLGGLEDIIRGLAGVLQ